MEKLTELYQGLCDYIKSIYDINFPPSPHFNCGGCSKFISERNRRISCDHCLQFQHVKCAIKTSDFNQLTESGTGWMCLSCRLEIFPFANQTNDELHDIFNDDHKNPLL